MSTPDKIGWKHSIKGFHTSAMNIQHRLVNIRKFEGILLMTIELVFNLLQPFNFEVLTCLLTVINRQKHM